MDMGWYQLVFHYSFRLGNALVFSTCFIIQELEFHQNITVFETLHDGFVGEQSMFVGVRLEGSGNDSIGITMIRNSYILISTVREYRMAASIISINVSDVFNPDVQFIVWCRFTRDISRLRYCVAFGLRWLGIGR